MPDIKWIKDFLMVVTKILGMMILSLVMRLRYWIDPEARKRDIEKMTKDGKYEVTEENKKYWHANDADNLTDFLFTTKQIKAAFQAMMQDINKTASIYSAAPNPEVFDSKGNKKLLLSSAKNGVPLIINFGSCT